MATVKEQRNGNWMPINLLAVRCVGCAFKKVFGKAIFLV